MKLSKREHSTKNHVSLSESNIDKHQENGMENGKGSNNDGGHYTLMMYYSTDILSVSFYFRKFIIRNLIITSVQAGCSINESLLIVLISGKRSTPSFKPFIVLGFMCQSSPLGNNNPLIALCIA